MSDSASGVADDPVQAVRLHGEDNQDVRNISVVREAAADNVPQNVPVSVSNTDINVKLGDERSLIFNTLLTLRLEEFYSYTEKIQQKRTRKTKQNKGKLCTANNYIQ